MKPVQILEPHDLVLPTDWCRPLQLVTMSGGHSDYYSFVSEWSGQPENNVKWVPVSEIFGEYWMNKPIQELIDALELYYEFIRGDIPESHQYGETNRQKRVRYEKYLEETIVHVGKHKGSTWAFVKKHYTDYYEWALSVGLVEPPPERRYG